MLTRKTITLALIFLLSGCTTYSPKHESQNPNSPFTHGNVQLTLKKGITTQSEVLESFGAPNIATIDSEGHEVWTYQKNATVTSSTENTTYGTVVLFGSKSTSTGFEQNSRTMTLILKFDSSKTVVDFKSMSTSF